MLSLSAFADLGAIDQGRAAIRERVVAAWDAFLVVADSVDLHAPSRLPRWRAQEICVHLGSWDDYQPVNGVLAAARAALEGHRPSKPPNPDDVNASVVRNHRYASRSEVLAALERGRDQAAEYLRPDDPQELDEVPVVSTVGPLPALTILHAQMYELAVHSLDLYALGGSKPGNALLDGGLAAMTDGAGALAARVGLKSTAGLQSDVGAWAFRSGETGWQIGRWGADAARDGGAFEVRLPVQVDAPAQLLLEASAGRINPFKAVVTRQLKVSGMPGLLGLAPIVQTVPGIPGGPALRAAAKGLAGAGGALGRLSRL